MRFLTILMIFISTNSISAPEQQIQDIEKEKEAYNRKIDNMIKEKLRSKERRILLPESEFPITYQWVDNTTKTPYLSGKMPYWYEGKIQHPNPPCTIVWQRGTIIDDTCETNEKLAKQYAQKRKDFIEERDEIIRKNKRLNRLREEGKVEIGLSESDVIYILGEPTRTEEETDSTGTLKTLYYDYTYGYSTISLGNGVLIDFYHYKR